jgi:hypothetical protein
VTPDEKRSLKALFVATALYFNQDIADAALGLYIDDLEDLPFPEVAQALKDIRRNPKTTRCPLPSAIRANLNPESDPESEATLLASRIVGLVVRIGPYASSSARLAMGPVAWEVVHMEGGWESVCQSLTYDNMTTMKAQWRNTARALLERGKPKKWADYDKLEDKTSLPRQLLENLFKDIPK